VSERVTLKTEVLGSKGGWEHYFQWLLDRYRLHRVRVGRLLLVSHAPLELDNVPAGSSPVMFFWADRAPADAWFALLEQITGRHVEHGAAPISICTDHACADDVLRATALASRVPSRRKALEDLAPMVTLRSGKRFRFTYQACAMSNGRSFALVNGRVLGVGDELVPGVKLCGIRKLYLSVTEGREPEDLHSE